MLPPFYPNSYNYQFPLPQPSPSQPPSTPSQSSSSSQCSINNAVARPPEPLSNIGEERVFFRNVICPTSGPTHETEWSTSLFGCFAGNLDPSICPCIVAGQIAEIVNEGKTSCIEGTLLCLILNTSCCCTNIYTCHNRSKMRRRYMLKGANSSDFMTHLHCMHCALCQEYRELYRLGFDPSIGWFENMERDRRAVDVYRITPPTIEEGMHR